MVPTDDEGLHGVFDVFGPGRISSNVEDEERDPTFRLEVKSISVVRIKANIPQCDNRMVSRHRYSAKDDNLL